MDQPLALRCLRFTVMQMSAFLTVLLFSRNFFVRTHYGLFEKPLWTRRCMWSSPYLQVGSPVFVWRHSRLKPSCVLLFCFFVCGVFKHAAASVRSPMWLAKPAFQQPSSAGTVKWKGPACRTKALIFLALFCVIVTIDRFMWWSFGNPVVHPLAPPPVRGKMYVCTPLNPPLETSSNICIAKKKMATRVTKAFTLRFVTHRCLNFYSLWYAGLTLVTVSVDCECAKSGHVRQQHQPIIAIWIWIVS